MEKVLAVIPVVPWENTWKQPFWVHTIKDNQITETYVHGTELYEWGCKTCKLEEGMYCIHVRTVREFVHEEMDKALKGQIKK